MVYQTDPSIFYQKDIIDLGDMTCYDQFMRRCWNDGECTEILCQELS